MSPSSSGSKDKPQQEESLKADGKKRLCSEDTDTVLVPYTAASQQTTLAVETHVVEGQFLLQERTLDIELSPKTLRKNSKTSSILKEVKEF
jgi:hypothetical protein